MNIFHTDHTAFKPLLACFSEFPRIIPASSIIVTDDKKPLALVCLYHDAGVVFVHGLYKSRDSTAREFFKATQFAEKYVVENIVGKFAVVTFTNKRSLKKLFIKNNFNSEEITMLVKGVQ